MSVESEMQTLVNEQFTKPKPRQPWLGIGLLVWVLGTAVANGPNLTSATIFAIAILPMIIADFRNHHNRLAIIMLNGVLAVLVATVIKSDFGGILMFALVFTLSSIGWLAALVWSCTRVK
jgi:hypothetical protein